MGRLHCSPESDVADLVHRVGWRQGLAAGFANLDGAVFTFVFTAFLLPDLDGTGDRAVGALVDIVIFLVYIGVAGAIGAVQCFRRFDRRASWLTDGLESTPERRAAVLRLPYDQAVFNLIPWGVAAVLFSALSAAFGESSAEEAVRLGSVIALGGLVSVVMSFLLVERAMRPLFALALGGEVPKRTATLGVAWRLKLTWLLGSGIPLLGITLLNIKVDGADVRAAVVALAAAGLVAGLVATEVAARAVADPLGEVRAALAKVEEGHLDVRVTVDDSGDVGRLQAGVNRMVEGLRERHRLADLFGRHVGTEVARRALVEGAGLESEQREASALFVDIVGSTAMAEVLPPEDVVQTLNVFFDAVVAAVAAEGGWVNKFEGDGALCVFGAPAAQPDHAARALRAARILRQRIDDLAASHPGLDAAIGVSAGTVVAGNVGTEQRYEYTIIGRPVNEAARLSELAKSRPGRALASAGAIERAGAEGARWSGLGAVALRGQQAPTAIYEPAESVTASA
jgi:adenylate cyclase